MQDPSPARCKELALTQDEAMTLLDLCVMTHKEHDTLLEGLSQKVGVLCREFLRSEDVLVSAQVLEMSHQLQAA